MNHNAITADLIAAFDAVARKYGLKVNQAPKIKKTPFSLFCGIGFDIADAAEAKAREGRAVAHAVGLHQLDFDYPIKPRGGRTFSLVGINPDRPRRPCIIRRDDGKEFICAVEFFESNRSIPARIAIEKALAAVAK